MTRRSPLRTVAISLVALGLPSLLLGCPKKAAPIEYDAGVAPVVELDAGVLEIAPLDEVDAGVDASDAAVKHATGTGLTTTQAHAKQCCNALRSQAKQMGNSPEAQQLLGVATFCDGVALQLGPTAGGQSPELAPLRQLLKGRSLPPLCQGL